MALGAYAQLDSINTDARYHAAVLRLQVGDAGGALALADTILARSPGHLFGYVVRGTAAGFQGDTATARRAGREFLSHYDAELKANRIEYREHEPAIEDFKRQAESASAMTRTIRVAHSPDSDDAFMFYALAEGKIDTGDLRYVHELSDIESLNQRARQAELEVTAVSIHAYAYLWRDYALLGSGSSMGDGYGPRLVATRPRPSEPRAALRGLRVGVPGKLTTAYLALQLYQPDVVAVVIPFDQIEDAVHRGDVDVGLLIHEGQLTYADTGLHLWADLGAWWLEDTGPAPPARRQRRPAGSRPRGHRPDRPGPPGQHRVRAGAPGAGPGACQAVQPRHRRRAHRHLRRHVRQRLDRGLRPAGSRGGSGAARSRARGGTHSRARRGRVRRVIDPVFPASYLPGTLNIQSVRFP